MRIGRWFKRIVLGATGSILVTTLYLVVNREVQRQHGNRELAAAFAETEATDPDWRWETLSARRRVPPPEHNSGEVVRRARELMPPAWSRPDRLEKWEPTVPPLAANIRLPEGVITECRENLAHVRTAL